MPKRYAIGVVNYKTYDDLARCLESVKAQSLRPSLIQVVDFDPDPARAQPLREAHPDVEWIEGANRGFGAGANEILRPDARSASGRTDAVLLMNPDVELAPDFCATLLAEMQHRPNVAIASGKLVRPEGVIDSAGIDMPRHRRPFDRGSGEVDRGQYDRIEKVFAVCGAAMMIRSSALAKLAVDGEIFDEDFFTYREDTDLCWRAHRLGFDVLYAPEARATHVRRWRPCDSRARATIPLQVRRHSFKNHYLQLVKNEGLGNLLKDLPIVLAFECVRFAYVLLRDPRVLPAYVEAMRGLSAARAKRRHIDAGLKPTGDRAAGRLPVRSPVPVRPAIVAAISAATPSDFT